MSPKVAEIIEALKADTSDRIVSCIYTWAFKDRAAVSAAFRIAKKQGIIRIIGWGGNNNPIYSNRPE